MSQLRFGQPCPGRQSHVFHGSSPRSLLAGSRALLAALFALLALPCWADLARAQVPIVFSLPSDRKAEEVFVQFLGDDSHKIDGYYYDSQGTKHPLANNTPYSLATLTGSTSVGGGAPSQTPSVMVNKFEGGRVYINYGSSGLTHLGGAYIPDPKNTSDPNKSNRYQFFEPTITGHSLFTNLSYIDCLGISLSLEGVNASHGNNTSLKTTASTSQMAKAAANAASSYGANIYPSSKALDHFSTDFVRVLTPHNAGFSAYHDWSDYLKYLKGKTATLDDLFVGLDPQPNHTPALQQQNYKFQVSFGDDEVLLTALSGSGNGHAASVPKNLQGTGVGDNKMSIAIKNSDLNRSDTYGLYVQNIPYSVSIDGKKTSYGSIQNDFYGRVVSDVLAGMSYGFFGSTEKMNGKEIGSLSSAHWWGGTLSDGTHISYADSVVGHSLAFSKAQPGNSKYYDNYAANLSGMSQGYLFPFQDRAGQTLMSFNTGSDKSSYLRVTINKD